MLIRRERRKGNISTRHLYNTRNTLSYLLPIWPEMQSRRQITKNIKSHSPKCKLNTTEKAKTPQRPRLGQKTKERRGETPTKGDGKSERQEKKEKRRKGKKKERKEEEKEKGKRKKEKKKKEKRKKEKKRKKKGKRIEEEEKEKEKKKKKKKRKKKEKKKKKKKQKIASKVTALSSNQPTQTAKAHHHPS
jgi:Mg-chelatase subunit ChlI